MHRYRKHYTREEARALLPQLRKWLDELDRLRVKLESHEERLAALTKSGDDTGGEVVNERIRVLSDIKDQLKKFEQRDIMVKDVRRGLVDFPALIGGKEVFLCWEKDEDDIEYWHDIDSGYAGREKL